MDTTKIEYYETEMIKAQEMHQLAIGDYLQQRESIPIDEDQLKELDTKLLAAANHKVEAEYLYSCSL